MHDRRSCHFISSLVLLVVPTCPHTDGPTVLHVKQGTFGPLKWGFAVSLLLNNKPFMKFGVYHRKLLGLRMWCLYDTL